MNDKLKQRARDISWGLFRDRHPTTTDIESALLQFACEALREEPDGEMSDVARSWWSEVAEARARGLE